MAYYTGTQAASATIASDFMTTFDSYIISGGFTFVETYTSGTDVSNIYKSPAGSNSLAMDWYLSVSRPSTGGAYVSFGVAEAYNSSTHLFTKYAPTGVPTTANTTDFTVSDAGVLPSAVANGASIFRGPNTGTGSINTTTTYTWYLNVTPDRVIFGKSTPIGASSSSTNYAGILDPLVDNFNVVIGTLSVVNNYNITNQTNSYGAMTRDYGLPATVSGATSGAYAWHIQNSTNASGGVTSAWGSTYSSYGDTIYGNSSPRVYKIPIFTSRGSTAYNYVGLLKDMVAHYDTALSVTIVGGDTLAVTNSTGTYNYVRSDSYSLVSNTLVQWIPKQ